MPAARPTKMRKSYNQDPLHFYSCPAPKLISNIALDRQKKKGNTVQQDIPDPESFHQRKRKQEKRRNAEKKKEKKRRNRATKRPAQCRDISTTR